MWMVLLLFVILLILCQRSREVQFLVDWGVVCPKPNYEAFDNVCRKRGNFVLYKFPIIQKTLVAISDLELAKKMMLSPTWANRFSDDHYLRESSWNKPIGLVFGNGEYWRQSRRFVIKVLHELDFYRVENLEKSISYEVNQLESLVLKQMDCKDHAILAPGELFHFPTANIVFQVILGQRFEPDNAKIHELLQCFKVANREFSAGSSVLEVFPWLGRVPGLTYLDSYKKFTQEFTDFFRVEVLQKRRQARKYLTEPKDLADYYLLEIDKHAGDEPNYVTDEALLMAMTDLFIAGSDTSSAVLEYAFLYLSTNPGVQRKLHQEIDEVVGCSRPPLYSDMPQMVYTQAVILEALRLGSVVPVTSRSAIEDTTIDDHGKVNKGTLCGIGIYSIHRANNLWDNPEAFRPERFLSEDGKSIVNKDKIIPFGYGTRSCMGKTVANVTLFIFLTSVLQKFNLELSADEHHSDPFKNTFGLTRAPSPFDVKISLRKSS